MLLNELQKKKKVFLREGGSGLRASGLTPVKKLVEIVAQKQGNKKTTFIGLDTQCFKVYF